jgi:hypothetical protein
MRKRSLFADVENFRLFDLYDANGNINENVFAYSNRSGEESALVLYNNSYYEATGWLQLSAPYAYYRGEDQKHLHHQRFAEAIGLSGTYRHFVIFQEQRSGLWYIRNSGDVHERGLFVYLRGYESQVFLNMYEVEDGTHNFYARLTDRLGGMGTPDIDLALKRITLQPLHDAFGAIANSGVLRVLGTFLTRRAAGGGPSEEPDRALPKQDYESFLRVAAEFAGHSTSISDGVTHFEALLGALDTLCDIGVDKSRGNLKKAGALIRNHLTDRHQDSAIILALLLFLPLEGFLRGQEGRTSLSSFSVLDQAGEWLLVHQLEETFNRLHPENPLPAEWKSVVQILLVYSDWFDENQSPEQLFRTLYADDAIITFLMVNTHQGATYFNQERFEVLNDWLFFVASWRTVQTVSDRAKRDRLVRALYLTHQAWRSAEVRSEYRIDRLIKYLGDSE